MSDRLVPVPYFPVAPSEYDQVYFSEVVRAFSVYLQQARNPGEGRNTFSVYTNLQTDDFNLEIGTVFNHDGFLKVATGDRPHTRGVSATGTAGSVTVLTP